MDHFTRLILVVSIVGIAISDASLGAELKVPGLGAIACEEVSRSSSTTDQDNFEQREIKHWTQGYLSGLMTAHAIQASRSNAAVMGTAIAIDYDLNRSWAEIVAHCQDTATDNVAQAVMAVAVSLGVLQDEAPSVPGVYLLIEVNGEQLPAISWGAPNGERCKQEILDGALILDDEGKSAAFVTSRTVCPNEDGSESAPKEESVIFPGSYVVSGNQITVEDDFGTDHAVLNGDILLYRTGGEGRPVNEFALRRR